MINILKICEILTFLSKSLEIWWKIYWLFIFLCKGGESYSNVTVFHIFLEKRENVAKIAENYIFTLFMEMWKKGEIFTCSCKRQETLKISDISIILYKKFWNMMKNYCLFTFSCKRGG